MSNKQKKQIAFLIMLMFILTFVIIAVSSCSGNSNVVMYLTDGNGTIVGEASQSVEYGGSTTTVTAIPNEGYRFVGWSDGVETATRTDENVKSDITVTAEFEKLIYTVQYLTDGNGTIVGEANQSIAYGGNATTVTAVPNEGYRFVGWSDGVETAERTDREVKSNITVTAEFEKLIYTVQYLTDGNGTIVGEASQSIAYGESTTTVTAIPNEGYRFVGWSDGVETAERIDRELKSNITVTAEFERLIYSVQYFTDGNGTIVGDVSQSVEHGGSTTTVTAVPNEGYRFVGWSDGVETATRTDENVKSDIAVTAEFEKLIYQVNYETNNPIYGTLIEENEKYDVIRIKYQIAYGEDAPIVRAYVRQNELGEDFVFLYWSDGVTTEERQDTNITSDLTVTAYFGYKVEYKVNGNVGGRIEGNAEQKLLPGEVTEQVTAVPYDGYVFCGWSDLSWETSRSGDSAVLGYLLNYSAVWEYVAYFEPIKKTFSYDYGIASGTPLATQITLNRNDIQSAKFVVPEYEGYTFCGWYADSDYRIRITTDSGRYMYGYAAFSLETNTIYAKWQKVGEETDNHKILLIFVDELQAMLYSDTKQEYFNAYYKMSALDYAASKWVAKSIYDLLNEWFDGEVHFEVDSYYTVQTIKENSFPVRGSNQLYSDNISEVFDLMYSYHNILTTVGYGEYESELRYWGGIAYIKNACVGFGVYWDAQIINGIPLQEYLSELENSLNFDYNTLLEVYLHEFAHTAEMNFAFDYDLHTALTYSGKQDLNMPDVIKPYLLGKFEMNGEMCGVPMEYWKHQNPILVGYVDRPVDQRTVGRIVVIGEEEDPDRQPWETAVRRYLVYGSDFSVETVPIDGYRFVAWSDGITTAIRHDVNMIAYFRVEAIFEKI